MKQSVRIISLLLAAVMLTCALSACGRGTKNGQDGGALSSASFTPHKFGPEDAVVNGLQMGVTTPEQTKELLGATIGQPDDMYDLEHPHYDASVMMTYDEDPCYSYLEFYDIDKGGHFALGVIHAETPAFRFVNDLHVGSTKDEVLATFTYEEDPAPLYFLAIMERDAAGEIIYGEPMGTYIYGDTNSTWFEETKPTGAMQYAYTEPRPKEYGNAYTMTYDYCEPLNWNADKSDFTSIRYHLDFFLDGETDTVTEISLSYHVISEYMC